ncbi:MAG: AAA family ATPase, partial [Firmicutes bacterium]|nr:AAA family ATPase [Bacillota bacterium]
FVQLALSGKNILVDACIGSGKTTSIQHLCNCYPANKQILYLTYNKLLKLDAQSKIKNQNVTVTNYHGFAAKYIKSVSISDLVQSFNTQKPSIKQYDILIIDEYQDLEQELANMVEYIKYTNPSIQIIAVGDMQQKIYDKTTLDVSKFIDSLLGTYKKLEFTQCFRLSSQLASKLGRIWNKKINGINDKCDVISLSQHEVVKFLAESDPSQILCLGARRGSMADTLNQLENDYRDKFNKHTVYASIADGDRGTTIPKTTSAIFTTFDSAKGLERPICVVFDYTQSYWDSRIKQPMQKYDILRNIFCVAASRGKNKIIFVKTEEEFLSEETLSQRIDDVASFKPFNMSSMFDFKYKEDIEDCYRLLNIYSINDDIAQLYDINIKNNDGLIDLSPCIGMYQEAVYFNNFNIDNQFKLLKLLGFQNFYVAIEEYKKLTTLDEKILFLTAIETRQDRYRTQVIKPFVDELGKKLIIDRLSARLNKYEQVQVDCKIGFRDYKNHKDL